MMDACRILVLGETDEAAKYLASLGIPLGVLENAARDGEYARDNCHEYHPPSFPGSVSWADTLRSLALGLKPIGYERDERNGLSVVVSPNGKHAISIQLGDEGTGDPTKTPTTKYPKGDATRDLVTANRTLILPGMEGHLRPKTRPLPDEGCKTWFFLRRRPSVKRASSADPTRRVVHYLDHVFLELSLPIVSEIVSETDDDDPAPKVKVTGWSVRIILGKVSLPRDPILVRANDEGPLDEMDGRIDIPVPRK